MRIVALIFGAVLLIVAVRGTEQDSAPGANDGKGFWPLLKNDFESKQFRAWVVAIILLGILGSVDALRPVTNTLIALLVVVLLLSKGQFFDQFSRAVLQPSGVV